MLASDFDYHLPAELIAQQPIEPRDHSRLLVLERRSGAIQHRRFFDLPEFLAAGDVLVLNDTRVIPARLHASEPRSARPLEVFLVEEVSPNVWWTLVRPGKRVRAGAELRLLDAQLQPSAVRARALEKNAEGHCLIEFLTPSILAELPELGRVPLPPYITRPSEGPTLADAQRYQTIYGCAPGSVAAPTAGLHFTPDLLARLEAAGIVLCRITLHVGLGTFAPVKSDQLAGHVMHAERYEVGASAAVCLNAARERGARIVAVGTTSTRVLETVGGRAAPIDPGAGRTRLFIIPPWNFALTGALVTNFHLPRSTLLMLVSAFADPGGTGGRARILQAYREAAESGYRFYSYGDAMLIL